MLQCTRSLFSKTRIAVFVFSGICFGNSVARSQTTPASPQALGQQGATQVPPELDGQIDKTLKNLKREFERRKASEPSLAAKENRAPTSAADLAKDAAEFVLDSRNALALYAVSLAQNDPKIVSSAAHATNSVKTEADEARVDKQAGSSSSSSGSTSLTSHGSVPAILAVAVEDGALEKSVSGTTITFHARPVQVIQALQKTPFYDAYAQIEDNGTLSLLNRFSFALSFDTSRGNSSATFTGSTNQVSGFSTTVDIYNHRDSRDKRYKPRWDRLQAGVAQDMALSLYNLFDALTSEAVHPMMKAWMDETVSVLVPLLVDGNDDEISAQLKERLKSFPAISEKIPGGEVTLREFATASTAVQSARQNIFNYVDGSPILTFEYANNVAAKAPSSQLQLPGNSDFKIIFEKGLKGGGSFATNFSATIFNSKPTGIVANQLRDLQASFQLDVPVNTSFPKIGSVVASFSGKYEHIPSDGLVGMIQGVTPIASDATLKGNLGIGQAKITFPVKGSGIKIPLSITWANRTELIKEKEVRGNIGLTFDLDTIISKFKE
jgi:hypothetical protein